MNQLIELQAIRSVIKRSFDGDSRTIICEILQSAQRSGASEIRFDINITQGIISVSDNGSGIDDFSALLVLGKSNYSLETVSRQHPMGVGFHSLLACDRAKSVTVISNDRKIVIDTQKWWTDYEYAQSWPERLVAYQTNRITKIEIQCSSELARDWQDTLVDNNRPYYLQRNNPALGYALVELEIYCNGVNINNSYPQKVKEAKLLVECKYNRNNLKIYKSHAWEVKFQYVNWYGQLIPLNLAKIPFSFILEVKQDTSVDLQSPTRNGPIYNARWHEFIEFLTEAIAAQMRLKEAPDINDLKNYYKMQLEFPKLPESPWFVAELIIGYEEECYESAILKEEILLRYDGTEVLVDGLVRVKENNEWYEYEGFESFVELVSQPLYRPKSYTESLLASRLNTIYWQPGEKIETQCSYPNLSFHSAGRFAIALDPEQIQWQKVEQEVYVLDEKSWSGINDIGSWIIGCTSDPATAFDIYSLAGHSYDRDSDYEIYYSQVEKIAVELRDDTIPDRFCIEDLKKFIARRQIDPKNVNKISIEFTTDDAATIRAFTEGKTVEYSVKLYKN